MVDEIRKQRCRWKWERKRKGNMMVMTPKKNNPEIEPSTKDFRWHRVWRMDRLRCVIEGQWNHFCFYFQVLVHRHQCSPPAPLGRTKGWERFDTSEPRLWRLVRSLIPDLESRSNTFPFTKRLSRSAALAVELDEPFCCFSTQDITTVAPKPECSNLVTEGCKRVLLVNPLQAGTSG